MASKTKNVRIIVKGVSANLPEDRIAYLVNSVMGHRATSVDVEETGEGEPVETGEEKARSRVRQVAEKLTGQKAKDAKDTGNAESA